MGKKGGSGSKGGGGSKGSPKGGSGKGPGGYPSTTGNPSGGLGMVASPKPVRHDEHGPMPKPLGVEPMGLGSSARSTRYRSLSSFE